MLFRVGRRISRDSNVDGKDAIYVKSVLAALGFYDEPASGLSPQPDEPMFSGIERFQAANGLRPDAVIARGGKTERALNDHLRARLDRLAAESRQERGAGPRPQSPGGADPFSPMSSLLAPVCR